MNKEQALENLYSCLANENEDIDMHIRNLKDALKQSGEKQVQIDPNKLFQNNREGRKMLQSYCKRRGVKVTYAE